MSKEDIKSRGLIFTGCHLPYNPNLVDRARMLRKNMTSEEKKLWYDYFKLHEKHFRRQYPIDNYIVDFYCADAKLVIELDGEQHYTEGGKNYDEERDAVLASYGLKILRFSNGDIVNKFDIICSEIECNL
jgi:very-short-patch-repair endonuclease